MNLKTKVEIIKAIYKSKYICKNGHPLVWQGGDLIFRNDLMCDKCGKYSENKNPIRWKCPVCNIYFCSLCFEIFLDRYCPSNHQFKYIQGTYLDMSTTYTCDKCYQILSPLNGVLYESSCNITYCPNCFYPALDIPATIED